MVNSRPEVGAATLAEASDNCGLSVPRRGNTSAAGSATGTRESSWIRKGGGMGGVVVVRGVFVMQTISVLYLIKPTSSTEL